MLPGENVLDLFGGSDSTLIACAQTGNDITECFHNKMEMISRRAFGFRNFENYRLRVGVLCAY